MAKTKASLKNFECGGVIMAVDVQYRSLQLIHIT
jgi:hypothetical protein